MTIFNRARLIAALLAVFVAFADDRFPERAKDSEPILDEQYRQMDRYFEQQIERATEQRARYWSRLDMSNPAGFDRSAEAYRKDWGDFLRVPYSHDLPLNV